ncbi:hypothetical protein DNI29_12805 [Hymenobacter sediminis]|uniref:hypothetical protein n=1 Tax=Hymenobacter sediminis TaxID=2218621 RepID=UPI000DA65774|nr:hypothetical protein [Hymenobacter sediminis]RPD47030.1 hypothetical protein DNI29_12805 [Hymenobacter sediminis]
MALVLHITLALAYYLLRQRINLFRGNYHPVVVYLGCLFLLVVLPYVLGELVRLSLHISWQHSSFFLLLPHLYMLLIQKQIRSIIRQSFSGRA